MDLRSLAPEQRRHFAHDMRLRYQDEIIQVMQDLLRIPSPNHPPTGDELACQEYIAAYLQRAGLPAEMYEPDTVPGMVEHPEYWPGRSYRGRPNVNSILPGRGGGRSLLLTGHVDTVTLGDNVWTHPPFGAQIDGGRMYGLGAIDMKGQMGAALVLYKAIREHRIPLLGTLSYEIVVDEEEGGVNGTFAGRMRYGPMDGAVVMEGTNLQIYPAARGALITDFIFASTEGTWLEVGMGGEKQERSDAVEQIGIFLSHLDEFKAVRRAVVVPSLYEVYPDPVPAQITKVYAGGWGSQVPIAVPTEGRIEFIVQTLPGETEAEVQKQQDDWLDSVIARHRDAFAVRPRTQRRIRWMRPTAIDPAHPLVVTMVDSAAQVMGEPPKIVGAPYACDMFALHQFFNMPALLFGPTGANAHAADEYVDLESVFAFWESLLIFTLEWCGVAAED
jgi:acetylornithine deacetylase